MSRIDLNSFRQAKPIISGVVSASVRGCGGAVVWQFQLLRVENGVAVVVEAGKSDESFSRGFLDLALRWPDSLDGTRLRVEH